MAATVKQFSQHRVDGTELQVIADTDCMIQPVIETEKAVIQGYLREGLWPHERIMLFILADLQPLVRQLQETASLASIEAGDLGRRPMVNVYNLADPATCSLFVNRGALEKEGIWDDAVALAGMLAHEHAHPLAENRTIRSSRCLKLDLTLGGPPRAQPRSSPTAARQGAKSRARTTGKRDAIEQQLIQLAERLCLFAPQEVFANEVVIRYGFAESLLHLDRHTVACKQRLLADRHSLHQRLEEEVAAGRASHEANEALLLVGDLQNFVEMALEIAPFYRAGRQGDARELEGALESAVFRELDPQVAKVYRGFRDHYRALRDDFDPDALMAWDERLMTVLAEALAEKGLRLQYRLGRTDGR